MPRFCVTLYVVKEISWTLSVLLACLDLLIFSIASALI